MSSLRHTQTPTDNTQRYGWKWLCSGMNERYKSNVIVVAVRKYLVLHVRKYILPRRIVVIVDYTFVIVHFIANVCLLCIKIIPCKLIKFNQLVNEQHFLAFGEHRLFVSHFLLLHFNGVFLYRSLTNHYRRLLCSNVTFSRHWECRTFLLPAVAVAAPRAGKQRPATTVQVWLTRETKMPRTAWTGRHKQRVELREYETPIRALMWISQPDSQNDTTLGGNN